MQSRMLTELFHLNTVESDSVGLVLAARNSLVDQNFNLDPSVLGPA